MDEIPETVQGSIEFTPCSICGRTFNSDVLVRHEKICAKNTTKKRPVFQSSKQRILGTDIQKFVQSLPPSKRGRPSTSEQKAAAKKVDWRRKHDNFINSVRTAREVDEAIRTGGPMPAHKPSEPNPDYVQCPYCKRRFQESAAERHIPFCKEQNSRLEHNPASVKAKQSLSKRMQYKPPQPRKKSGQNSEDGHTPVGASVVTKTNNFSATYTVSSPPDAGPGKNYVSAKSRSVRAVAAVRGGAGGGVVGSTSENALPGNTPGSTYQPRPPSDHRGKTGPIPRQTSFSKGRNGRLIPRGNQIQQGQQERQLNPLNSPKQNAHRPLVKRVIGANPLLPTHNRHGSISQGYSSGSDEQEHPPFDQHNGYHNHDNRIVGNRLTNGYRNHDDIPVGQLNSLNRVNSLDRIGSGSSVSSSAGQRRVPLNEHGMPMSKFCYECGTKFPVPQAKFCCECGTKRL